MNLLADDRPIFHAEADFQHALAWQIREEFPSIDIRLEVDVSSDDAKRHYLDIWLPSQGVAIELKYATRNLELEVRGELFKLRNQMAQPVKRYHAVKDFERIEWAVGNLVRCREAHAIFLTNDPRYWGPPGPRWKESVDASFRLHDGQELSGELSWSPNTCDGTKSGGGGSDPIEANASPQMERLFGCGTGKVRAISVFSRNGCCPKLIG